MKKNCGQVNIPEVDNTNPCNDYIESGCVIMNRNSNYVKSHDNDTLNEYLTSLESKLRKLEIRTKFLETVIKNQTNPPTEEV